MALIERKLGDGRNLTVDFHELAGYVVARVDGKVVIGKGVIGFLPETQTVNGKTFTHCIGESANCKVGVGLTAEEARSILKAGREGGMGSTSPSWRQAHQRDR